MAVSEKKTNLPVVDAGKKPELKWLPLTSLRINHSYQRSTESKSSYALINKIVADFCWVMFCPLVVCPQKGGVYNVIDGQHRMLGARGRGDITSVPCSITPPLTIQEEAAYFALLNSCRVRMHTVDVFHAAVAGGDEIALQVARVCRKSGIKICKAPFTTKDMPAGETQAIGTIRGEIKQGVDEETVVRALKCLNGAHPKTTGQLRSRMIQAVIRLFDMNVRAQTVIDDKRLQDIIAGNDAADLEYGARSQKKIYNGDLSLGIIDDLVGAYNDGLPMKKYIIGEAGK